MSPGAADNQAYDRQAFTPTGTIRAFWSVASGFWSRPPDRVAWSVTPALLALVILNLLVQTGINRWNRFFFDALQVKDSQAMFEGIGIVIALAVGAAAVAASFFKV